VASPVGLVALTVAAPAAARSGSEKPPVTLPGTGDTALVLQTQSFVTPKVFYRIVPAQDVLVVYDGGGPADPMEAIRQIEDTVWGHEFYRFDQVVIQNGNQAPTTISYADLEARFGPRPPGFAQPLSNVFLLAAFGNRGFGIGVSDDFTNFLDLFKVIATAIGVAALLATLAFVLASFLGSRRRVPDESEDRLFA
jgi:hypothetical protein